MAESAYVTVKGRAKCLSFDTTDKAFNFENDKGKIRVRKGKDIKDVKFSFGHMFELVLNKKKGTEVWYANEAVDLTGANPTRSSSSGGSGNSTGGGYYDSAGQERGNYRNNLSKFIIDTKIKTGEFPTPDQIKAFNASLKMGEIDMLTKKEPEITESDGVVEEAPEEVVEEAEDPSPF